MLLRRLRVLLRQRKNWRTFILIWAVMIGLTTFYLAFRVVDIPQKLNELPLRSKPKHGEPKRVGKQTVQNRDLDVTDGKCPALTRASTDVDMLAVYRRLKFDNPDGGAWKQGWDVTYDRNAITRSPKLRVFLVPHSHNDPGWKKTFDDYFRTETKAILDNLVVKLPVDPRRKFIWAETSYLYLWWVQATPAQRETMRRLAERGQLEIVTGGWVMPDEANSHYWTLIEQLATGNEWVKNNLGVEPKNGWSIDPFGLSSTYAFILKKAGFSHMTIQRVHYAIKKELSSKKELEFTWRQSWEPENPDSGITCHLMPFYSYDVPHTCGPDPKICCQFDFHRLPGSGVSCPWRVPPRPITAENVAERAALLMDQYRKKNELYAGNVLFVQLGDDFRYESAREWDAQYENYQRLFDYINNEPSFNAEVQFGTLADYFEALEADQSFEHLPSLTGDFFSYNDRNDNFWTGYFTSRAFYKHFDRLLMRYLRAADILFSAALANEVVSESESVSIGKRLDVARRALSLFQHHDGITGTSKDFVVLDYGSKLLKGLVGCEEVMSEILSKMTSSRRVPLKFAESMPRLDSLLRPTFLFGNGAATTAVLWNPSLTRRKEVVSFSSPRPDVAVVGVESFQISPDITPSSESTVKNTYIVSWVAEVEPLSVKTYSLKFGVDSRDHLASITVLDGGVNSPNDWTVNLPEKFPRHYGSDGDGFSVGNKRLKLEFDSSGAPVSVNVAGSDEKLPFRLRSMLYSTRAHGEASGAYLFLPNGPAKEYIVRDPAPVVKIEGPLFSRVVVDTPLVRRVFTVYESDGIDGLGFELKNFVDLRSERDKELAMRFESSVQSGDGFYTDSNGYQLLRRERFDKLGIQGNFYPMAASSYIEDSKWRLTLLAQQPAGVGSLEPGSLDVILDRRYSRDDDRGLGQGVMDNLLTEATFKVLIETRSVAASLEQVPTLSLVGNAVQDALLYPLMRLQAADGSGDEAAIGKRSEIQVAGTGQKLFPCDLELSHLRARSKADGGGLGDRWVFANSVGAIFRRHGHDCGVPDPKDAETRLGCSANYDSTLRLSDVLGEPLSSKPEETSITFRNIPDALDAGSLKLQPLDMKAFSLTLPKTK